MENKIIFGRWEATALIINLISTQIILGFPRMMIEKSGTGAWLLVIYISVLSFIGFFVIEKLYTPFEGKDFIDIGEYAGGSAGRIIAGSVLLVYFISFAAIILRQFAEDMILITLVETPISFVTTFFIAGMAAGAYFGLESVVRLTAIALPVIVATFFFITIGASPYFDFTNLFPVLGHGLNNIFISGSLKVSVFSALIVLFLLPPYIKKHENFKKTGYTAIAVTSVFFLWSVLSVLLIFTYPIAVEFYLPIFQIARLINLGRFMQRMESIFVISWAFTALLYLSTFFFFILFIFKKTFKLNYYKPLIMPFAVLIFNLSLLPPNLITAVEIEGTYFSNYAWIVTFAIPVVFLLIARNKKRNQRGNRQNV